MDSADPRRGPFPDCCGLASVVARPDCRRRGRRAAFSRSSKPASKSVRAGAVCVTGFISRISAGDPGVTWRNAAANLTSRLPADDFLLQVVRQSTGNFGNGKLRTGADEVTHDLLSRHAIVYRRLDLQVPLHARCGTPDHVIDVQGVGQGLQQLCAPRTPRACNMAACRSTADGLFTSAPGIERKRRRRILPTPELARARVERQFVQRHVGQYRNPAALTLGK